MANISPGEARLGWEIFLGSNGRLGKSDLEAQASQLGVGAISDRMYRHYRSLFKEGYDHYIPINRFDVLRAAEPFGNESANSRYKYSDLSVPVRVMAVRDKPYTFLAVSTRVSDAGIALQVVDPIVGESLVKGKASLRVGELLRIDFLRGSRPSVDGQLLDRAERHPTEESWLLDVEFTQLRSVVEFVRGRPMPSDDLAVRLVAADGGPVAADVLGKRFFHLLDAIENARSLVNDVADRETVRFFERATPARIERVHMDSPLEVVLVLPVGVGLVFGVVWALVRGGPKAYQRIQDGRLSGALTKKEHALAKSIEIDNSAKEDRNKTSALVHEIIRSELVERGASLRPIADPSRLFAASLDQLVENTDSLSREAVSDVELSFDHGQKQGDGGQVS